MEKENKIKVASNTTAGYVIFNVIGGSSEPPMWLTDGFLVTFFGRWRGAVHIHVSHVQLLYMVINVQDGSGGGIPNIGKLRKFGKLQIFLKVVGSISGHIRSYECQPS